MRRDNERKVSATDQYHRKHYHGAAWDKSVKGTARGVGHLWMERKEGVCVPEEDWERLS